MLSPCTSKEQRSNSEEIKRALTAADARDVFIAFDLLMEDGDYDYGTASNLGLGCNDRREGTKRNLLSQLCKRTEAILELPLGLALALKLYAAIAMARVTWQEVARAENEECVRAVTDVVRSDIWLRIGRETGLRTRRHRFPPQTMYK